MTRALIAQFVYSLARFFTTLILQLFIELLFVVLIISTGPILLIFKLVTTYLRPNLLMVNFITLDQIVQCLTDSSIDTIIQAVNSVQYILSRFKSLSDATRSILFTSGLLLFWKVRTIESLAKNILA